MGKALNEFKGSLQLLVTSTTDEYYETIFLNTWILKRLCLYELFRGWLAEQCNAEIIHAKIRPLKGFRKKLMINSVNLGLQ